MAEFRSLAGGYRLVVIMSKLVTPVCRDAVASSTRLQPRGLFTRGHLTWRAFSYLLLAPRELVFRNR